jgi:hypothetical protein
MSPPVFSKYQRQGQLVVARADDGSIVRNSHGEQLAAVLPPRAGKETMRRAINRLTNGGEDLVLRMLNFSAGVPIKIPGVDGKETEPIVPTAEVMLAATKDLLDRGWGKAVAQTEVVKAELEAEDAAQYAAMSDDALREAARPFLERAQKEREARSLPASAVTVTLEK